MTASEIRIGDKVSWHESDARRPMVGTVTGAVERDNGTVRFTVRDNRRGWEYLVFSNDRTLIRL